MNDRKRANVLNNGDGSGSWTADDFDVTDNRLIGWDDDGEMLMAIPLHPTASVFVEVQG